MPHFNLNNVLRAGLEFKRQGDHVSDDWMQIMRCDGRVSAVISSADIHWPNGTYYTLFIFPNLNNTQWILFAYNNIKLILLKLKIIFNKDLSRIQPNK